MREFRIGDVLYRTRHKMSARQQFHVARRLAPLIGQVVSLAPMLKTAMTEPLPVATDDPEAQAKIEATQAAQIEALIIPLSAALARISDEDCDYVLDQCMSVVQRNSGNGQGPAWSDIWNPRANRLMFEDIELPAMMQIAAEVIRENLEGFFSVQPVGATAPLTPVLTPTLNG